MKRELKGALPQQPVPWYQNNVEAQQQNPNVFIQPGISNQFLNHPDNLDDRDDYEPNYQNNTNPMYNELYHKVMASKSPNRILNNKVSGFDVYKEGWNNIQDRMDKNYQRQLRKVNHEAAKRMKDAQDRQELKLQQNALKYKQIQTE